MTTFIELRSTKRATIFIFTISHKCDIIGVVSNLLLLYLLYVSSLTTNSHAPCCKYLRLMNISLFYIVLIEFFIYNRDIYRRCYG